MDDPELDRLIREVSSRHGVSLGRQDPILILYTINKELAHQHAQHQRELLGQFKSELETIALQFSADAKTKSERILNAALAAAKTAMQVTMQAGAHEITGGLHKEITLAHRALERPVAAAHRVALLNMAAAGMTLAAVCVAVIWGLLR